jgi:hypothetical protein
MAQKNSIILAHFVHLSDTERVAGASNSNEPME